MNTEQKAKAYDGAIKKAREVYNNISSEYSSLKKMLENAFPELKESEDERIRKAIIEGLKEMKNNFHTISSVKIDDAIAWLEKQGEPKPSGKIQVSENLYEHIRSTCAYIDDALSSETFVDVMDYLKMASKDAISAFDMIEAKHERGS